MTRCLADLVENPRAARMFVQWNSDVTMKGGLKLLLELWDQEQVRRGAINDMGEVLDCDRPLNPPVPFVSEQAELAKGMTTQNVLMSSRTMGKQKVNQTSDRFAASDLLADVFNLSKYLATFGPFSAVSVTIFHHFHGQYAFW